MHFRYALRELKSYPRYTLFFIFNITLGLTGLSILENFKSAVSDQLDATSRSLAGGDLILSSRFEIPESEIEKTENLIASKSGVFKVAAAQELFSMVSSSGGSRLAQIKAQSADLPFYGQIELGAGGVFVGGQESALEKGDNVWVYPELLLQLKVKVGETIKVGGHPFTIVDVIEKDSSSQVGRGALAPRIFMSPKSLVKTDLLQKGSTVTHQRIYKIGTGAPLQEIQKEIRQKIKDTAINVNTHQNISESNVRLTSYLNDYLGLVSLIALLLSNIGTLYLFRAHLTERLKDMAILKMVGSAYPRLFKIYFFQALVLGALGTAVAFALSFVGLPFFTKMSSELLPFSIDLAPSFQALLSVGLVGVFGTSLCVWPLIRKTKLLSPKDLFQEGITASLKISWRDLGAWIPFILFFFTLSVWQAKSFKIAGLFISLIIVAVLLLIFLAAVGSKLISGFVSKSSFEFRFASRELVRRPVEGLTAFVALALGALSVVLIIVVESSLKSEFDLSQASLRPDLFVFDVQEEQIGALSQLIQTEGFKFSFSPMIRARLESINDVALEPEEETNFQTREEQASQRGRSRAYNLTERAGLSDSEELIAGKPFSGPYNEAQGLAEISLEERFADRMKIKVGDKLSFDILGVPVEGRVVSLRRVKWASFQPNFFVQFQPGVFKDTPKTFIGSVSQLDESQKLNLQNKVVEKFSNVSVLDVTKTVDSILALSTKMAWILKIMASLVFLSALAVTFSIQGFHIQKNQRERSLLHYLGVLKTRIQRIEFIETSVLSTSALLAGWCLSFLIVWPVTYLLFSRSPEFTWVSVVVFIPEILRVSFRKIFAKV